MKNLKIFTVISFIVIATICHSLPLSTKSRWIIDDETGQRVKLRCVSWAGHLQPMIPEGLHRKPLKEIAAFISSTEYNCVRLTYATYMYTRDNYTGLTVAESLKSLNLTEARKGVSRHNPKLMNLFLFEAQMAVVDELGANNLMVILDNHVSLPKWCCGVKDGNGFFGDEYFDPMEWLIGLRTVAALYSDTPTVVGMSMRNELRGPHQSEDEWYRFMQMGATTIHEQSQDFLVIVSGLSFDTNLNFLRSKSLELNFESTKLVYEAHWYPFGKQRNLWLTETNDFCTNRTRSFMRHVGFLMDDPNPKPLILSEFGVDRRGQVEVGNRYFSCTLAHLAEKDMDWGLWALEGNYMLREGNVEEDEPYGVFDANWDNVRSPKVQGLLQLVQQTLQDPKSNSSTNYLLYHPVSGQCGRVTEGGVYLGNCLNASKWSHDGDGSPIKLAGTSRCLSVLSNYFPPVLSDDCSSVMSEWKTGSISNHQMAAKDEEGNNVCLGWSSDSSSMIVTQPCHCLDDNLKDYGSCIDDPTSQWFKLIPTNVD